MLSCHVDWEELWSHFTHFGEDGRTHDRCVGGGYQVGGLVLIAAEADGGGGDDRRWVGVGAGSRLQLNRQRRIESLPDSVYARKVLGKTKAYHFSVL